MEAPGNLEAPSEVGYSPREEGYSPREGSVSAQSLSPGHDVDYVNPRDVRFTSHHRGRSHVTNDGGGVTAELYLSESSAIAIYWRQ